MVADEINRAPPRTQSGLLEAMQEGRVTIDDQTFELPRAFLVMATQNPLEHLLRAMGVPARNVNGFLGGEWNDFGRYLTVTQNHAHSWVEVWFPGYGWVLFDPTPAATDGLGAGARTGMSPLRSLLDGLEHRWGTWVLDFDLDTQVGLVRRAAEPPAPTHAAASRAQTAPGACCSPPWPSPASPARWHG